MKTKSKPLSTMDLIALIWGLVYTLLMLMTVGSKLILNAAKSPSGFISGAQESFSTWDDPAAYFYTYMLGYTIIWWKPLPGSIIIIAGSIYYVMKAGFGGPLIFAAPGFLVGTLYLADWIARKREDLKVAD